MREHPAGQRLGLTLSAIEQRPAGVVVEHLSTSHGEIVADRLADRIIVRQPSMDGELGLRSGKLGLVVHRPAIERDHGRGDAQTATMGAAKIDQLHVRRTDASRLHQLRGEDFVLGAVIAGAVGPFHEDLVPGLVGVDAARVRAAGLLPYFFVIRQLLRAGEPFDLCRRGHGRPFGDDEAMQVLVKGLVPFALRVWSLAIGSGPGRVLGVGEAELLDLGLGVGECCPDG